MNPRGKSGCRLAHSWRCKSSRELATANEVKRNCGRATDRGEEAWSVNREPMNKNRIRGTAATSDRFHLQRAQLRLSSGPSGPRCGAGCAALRQQGRHIVVDVDLSTFFDRVNHDTLIDRLKKRINDPGVIRLVRSLRR